MELYLCSMYTSCMGPGALLSAGAVGVLVIIIQGVTVQVCYMKIIAV